MIEQPLDSIPLWVIYPLTVLAFMALLEAGYWLGKKLKKKFSARSDAGVGAISGATLALLAFLVAFTVSFAMGVHTERRHGVVNEANAINNTYMFAEFLGEPHQTESRELLREYVDLRLEALEPDKLENAIVRSEEIHKELWDIAGPIGIENPDKETVALYISSLKELINVHAQRLNVGLDVRVPPALLIGMYVVGLLTMLLTGIGGGYIRNRNLIAQLVLVLVLSIVFYLIIDLDRSNEGLLKVPQQALVDLQRIFNP